MKTTTVVELDKAGDKARVFHRDRTKEWQHSYADRCDCEVCRASMGSEWRKR